MMGFEVDFSDKESLHPHFFRETSHSQSRTCASRKLEHIDCIDFFSLEKYIHLDVK